MAHVTLQTCPNFNLHGFSLWEDNSIANDAQLFTAVTGTGLHGSYVRPTTGSDYNPYSYIETASPGTTGLSLYVGALESSSVGLTSSNRNRPRADSSPFSALLLSPTPALSARISKLITA